LKILAGLITGTSGNVLINGVSISDDVVRAKKNISFMPENNPLPDHMRVGEYLRFRAELKGVPPKKIRANTEKVMRQCDLYHEARYRVVKTLSKGYRQRVGIADAMLGSGEIIILDEPTIGLDPHQVLGVRKIIAANKGTRTILISSHILSELETVCDYFIIINRGNIVASGTLGELASGVRGKNLFSAKVCGDEAKIKRVFVEGGAKIAAFERLANGICVVQFSASEEDYRLLPSKICEGNLFLRGIGDLEPSLEEVFLYSTRRCRDQDPEN
jgi:ABC-2 type transport system ATP-binding protein